MPLLSIIIPCYNSGQFLPEALESIRTYSDKSMYEVIIVNDGSTDKNTLDFLTSLSKEDYTIIHQINKGPAAARNAGVAIAKSEYLLFLDSDNKIKPAYIDRGIKILTSYSDVGVVHGNATFFGKSINSQFTADEFDMLKILNKNYIDMCSVIRKAVWEELGGFDENRVLIGHEDWEFWIRVGASRWNFFYVNEILFEYRIREDSLTAQAGVEERINDMLSYVYGKHWKLFLSHYKYLSRQLDYYRKDQDKPVRSFIKYLQSKYFTKKNSESDESVYFRL